MAYDITSREIPDQPIVSIRERIDQAELPIFFGRVFGELYGQLGRLGIAPDGEPFVIYHAFGPGGVDAEVCVPIATVAVPSDRIDSRVVPGATVVETLHVGPYDELGEAYSALMGWIGQHHFETAGPVRERYLNEPGPDVPPAAYRTIVQMPVVQAAVAAR